MSANTTIALADGDVHVTTLDRSVWRWVSAMRGSAWADPVAGWVEPGIWSERLKLPVAQLNRIRDVSHPAAPTSPQAALDGMFGAIEVEAGGAREWRRFHNSTRTQGMELARLIAEAVLANAETAHARNAAAAVLGYQSGE